MKIATKYLAALFLASAAASASDSGPTTITRLMLDQEQGLKLFIQVSANPSRTGGHCHINETWDYVISVQDEFGKRLHAQILAAYAAQSQVKFLGVDQCNVYPYIESAVRLEML